MFLVRRNAIEAPLGRGGGANGCLTEFSFKGRCRGQRRSAIIAIKSPIFNNGPSGAGLMRRICLPWFGGLIVGVAILMSGSAGADPLKDEIAPKGKLRVAIGISAAGGAYWSTKTESGYAGVPVDLGKALADQLGLAVEYVAYPNSGQITDAAARGEWDVSFLPEDPERAKKIAFGPIYEVTEATYIVKAGSSIRDFASLDQAGVRVAAVDNTTTMRGAVAHLKQAKVTGYQTFDEVFNLLKNGEVDAFALSRDQLTALAKKIPGSRVLDETFKQTVTAVAVPLNHPLSLEYASKFMAEAKSNGLLRKAFDHNGLKDTPLRAK
jgi:polar amino acid transport system substrate-binding protein